MTGCRDDQMTRFNRGERLWRLRRLHQSIDAVLIDAGSEGVDLKVLLNGEAIYLRRWPTRGAAVEDASLRRGDLEREGWMPHW